MNPRTQIKERISDALRLRQFSQMERWAAQWVAQFPQDPEAFLWLARASLACNKLPRAAYAFGRVLDFLPSHDEALKFFSDHPSLVELQPQSLQQKLQLRAQSDSTVGDSTDSNSSAGPQGAASGFHVSPKDRGKLATTELHLAESYEALRLFANAAEAFQRSLQWRHSEVALLGAARCHHRNFQSHVGERLLRGELNKRPEWINGRTLLAALLWDQGKKLDAQKEWQTVLRIQPENRQALDALRGFFVGTPGL